MNQKCITDHWFISEVRSTKILSFAIWGCLSCIGIICLFSKKLSIIDAIPACLLLFMLGFFMSLYGMVMYVINTRTFSLGEDGITIHYADFYEKQFKWSQISSIVICDVYHSPKVSDRYVHAIRFAIGKETDGPFNTDPNKKWSLSGHEKWSTYEYSLAHLHTVITLTFTPDRLEQIRLLSGVDVVDLTTKSKQ